MNESFWSKAICGADDICWPWVGARNRKGYGNFRSRSAHVVAYELRNGPIPSGLEVDHTCRNRACVNPLHLEAVTHAENVRRAQPQQCRRGHDLSGENVKIVIRADGTRRKCRACQRFYKMKKAGKHHG